MSSIVNHISNIEIIPTGYALGVIIKGVDLSQPLPSDTAKLMRETLYNKGVMLFENQQLTQKDQVEFTCCFGKPMVHVREHQPESRSMKEIFIVSNVKENGKLIGDLGCYELTYHSDLSYMEKPGRVSMLYAVDVPEVGGNTYWCNTFAAYEALDDEVKQRIKGLYAVHRHYVESQNPPAPVAHPVVGTHPFNKKKFLYVSPHLTKYIVNLLNDQQLLDQLFNHVSHPRFCWPHHWRKGDLVVWDNWGTMHRRDPFSNNKRRILWRTQIYNDQALYEELSTKAGVG